MKIELVIFLVAITGCWSISHAQYLVNQGADIRISPGSSLVIEGDFRNQLDGSMDNNGNVLISGNWTNNATSGNLLQGTSGTVTFNGSSVQSITGSAKTWFNNVNLQNDVALGTETSVSSDLTMSSNFVSLGTNDLVMEPGSAIIGAGPSGYIIANGSGQLVRQVGSSDVSFPVGTISAYTQAVLYNSGTVDNFGINVFPDVLENGISGVTIAEISDCVEITWNITEQTAGGSNLALTAFWYAVSEGVTFDRTHAGIGHYTGGAWDPQGEVPASGTGPYSITRSGITTLSAFAVGDLESPMAIPVDLRLNLAAFLEGPFNGVGMDNTLNTSGLLPASQPFNVAPWNYPGTETVIGLPPDWIDWVLIEIRDAPNAASATPATTVARKAALLLQDGSIVDVDGSSIPEFSVPIANQLFAVVWHRNHLGIMSANPLVKVGGIFSYDFTTAAGQAYLNGQKDFGGGDFGMYGGDGDANSAIEPADETNIWEPQAGSTGYKQGDFNLDGEINNPDKNDSWAENLGETSQVPN